MRPGCEARARRASAIAGLISVAPAEHATPVRDAYKNGLLWSDLLSWWQETRSIEDTETARHTRICVGSPLEHVMPIWNAEQ
ncbi:hypothetical protein [Streptomyces sp. NPDC006285]|uniref:hypothetical protein n=1 Tax=Streptomyces sp. NPDC006285 TaxID=3364742 RepID=UPI0036C96073